MMYKPDPDPARKFHVAARQSTFPIPPSFPSVLCLTDPERTKDLIALAQNLPRGWAVIYRHFGASNRHEMAATLRKITWRRRAYLLIGNDPKLAATVRADGVHWPERSVNRARYWKHQFAIATAAAHQPRTIRRAQSAGINAVLLSTVFSSESPSAGPPMGPIRFRNIAKCAGLPVYALGGISADNVSRIAGAAGIASVSGIAEVLVG